MREFFVRFFGLSLLFLLSWSINAIENELNLDVELVEEAGPTNWKTFGSESYVKTLDTEHKYTGKNSLLIEYQGENPNYGAWEYLIPAKYQGKRIKLTAYIKTENVRDGYAGLWMRIDPELGFDNMQSRGITGTTNWKKYEIELDLNAFGAEEIIFGGLLAGKGKVWFDKFELTIDEKELVDVPLKKQSARVKDIEFDNGSAIEFQNLSTKQIDDLVLLGKLWGFLKYHHPAVAQGEYHWDYELFRFLPRLMKTKTRKSRDKLLAEWIHDFGKIKKCDSCEKTVDDAVLKPDHRWFTEHGLSRKIKKQLQYIYLNRHQGNQFYVTTVPSAGNPVFSNEKEYSNFVLPDTGFRLLALYRYWNIINYYFPSKHLSDQNWSGVLKDYIPVFIKAKSRLDYELAALSLIAEINDTHGQLRSRDLAKLRGDLFPPFKVQFIDNELVISDYYNPELQEQSGLKIGDVITHVNGREVQILLAENKPYYPASNLAVQLRDMAPNLLRSNSPDLEITYRRDFSENTTTLKLYAYQDLNIYHSYRREIDDKSYKFLSDNIGYITLSNVKDEDVPEIKRDFKDTKGIVIDIRNYPATSVTYSLGSFFISKDVPFVDFTVVNINNPGEMVFLKKPLELPAGDDYYRGKLIVLVNEYTQSNAEFTAMAFRAGDNTTIIGSTTAGADGNYSFIGLPGGLKTGISGLGVYYPNGEQTQRVGIIPDVVIKPTVQGIREGRDELLEKAIEIINDE